MHDKHFALTWSWLHFIPIIYIILSKYFQRLITKGLKSPKIQQMNLWPHLPRRKALENGILKNTNHFMSDKVNIWTLGCVWVPNTKSNDVEGSGKIPHWKYRWLSPLLTVLLLYCIYTRSFESSRQKFPALLCWAEEDQGRGFLAGTFKRLHMAAVL